MALVNKYIKRCFAAITGNQLLNWTQIVQREKPGGSAIAKKPP